MQYFLNFATSLFPSLKSSFWNTKVLEKSFHLDDENDKNTHHKSLHQNEKI